MSKYTNSKRFSMYGKDISFDKTTTKKNENIQ